MSPSIAAVFISARACAAARSPSRCRGLQGYWRRRLELERRKSTSPPEALRIAALSARIGDAEQTAHWLERAYEERSMALPFVGVLPAYDRVRSHPRIAAILERMKLKRADARGPAAR